MDYLSYFDPLEGEERVQLWNVDFTQNPTTGRTFVGEDFLDKLHTKDKPAYLDIFDKLDRITSWDYENAVKSHFFKPIDDGLVEMRISARGGEVRFLGYISHATSTPTFNVLCGFRKKSQEIPQKYLSRALERREMVNSIRGPTK